MKKIYLAGGCFWGVEKYFGLLNGVIETSVGYANGNTANPTYQDVCSGDSKFAETVEVIYDEKVIDLKEILKYYFMIVDPISVNRQGNDIGIQYRTGIYYIDACDKDIISTALMALQAQYKDKVMIEIKPLENYYLAEEYHQDYLLKNPSGYCHIGNDKFDLVRNKNK